MSTPVSPVDAKLPTRSATQHTTGTATTGESGGYVSDDEPLIGEDTSETAKLLLERLRAWKHMCGYLEEYVEATAKVQKSHSKDAERVLKSISQPLREGHHFDQSLGGITGMFENLRNNTKGISNLYLETEKNLKGSVMPILERLHKEIKNKHKELEGGAIKGAKAVDKARANTTKHIELLGHRAASYDSSTALTTKIDPSEDPYVLRRLVNHKLNKQIIEENNNRKDTIAIQNSFQEFEAHVIQTVQNAINQFVQFMGGQSERQRAMYADMQACASNVPLEFEWINFLKRNDEVLIDPDSPPRSFSNVSFPNQDHASTKAVIEGSLERKSRTLIKGYQAGYYVVTPARYLHEFKDNDDFHKEPTPELSLYLPDSVIGGLDGNVFKVKGKDVSSGKVGNAFHTSTELVFKAHTAADAEKWWKAIKESISGPGAAQSATSPVSPIADTPGTTPAVSRQGTEASHASPTEAAPTKVDTKAAAETAPAATMTTPTAAQPATEKTDAKPAATDATHFHGTPGGTGAEKQ